MSVDPEVGIASVRLWIAAGSAALLVVACVLAFGRPAKDAMVRLARRAPLAFIGALMVGVAVGAAAMWASGGGVSVLGRAGNAPVHDGDAERRALELRAQQLSAQALAPGSPLACLDALAGEAVETACERPLFASPASVAAAVSFSAARLALLSDMTAYAKRGGAGIDGVMTPLRRGLEADRFGFVAHAIAASEGCSNLDCKALELLGNPSQVRANLNAETFERYVDRHQTAWAQPAAAPVAEALPPAPTQTGALAQRKVLVNIDFPTSASIPPISIMNPEPTKGPLSIAATNVQGAAAQKRARGKQGAAPADPPPVQDPVYLPAVPSPPAPPEANASAPARTQ